MKSIFTILAALLAFTWPEAIRAGGYDPLAVGKDVQSPKDVSVQDAARQREIPLRIYLPNEKGAAPVVLFSHGLGGSREGSSFLGRQWAARGYVAVFLQRHGSDSALWKGKPATEMASAMKAGITPQNFVLRVGDVKAVLDQLEKWNSENDQFLAGRLDLAHVAMSGHSFGATTTQAVSGQKFMTGDSTTDSRIKAAIIFSPSKAARGDSAQAFGSVAIPWMLMTGTNDVAKIGNEVLGTLDAKSRLEVYPGLPPGDKYELVLDGANHMVFTDRPEVGGESPRNPNHHRVILALTTAFLDAYLKNDAAAREWLQGNGPRKVMEEKDRWQKK